jgi:ABC-type amino acid transport substrate-binding protein
MDTPLKNQRPPQIALRVQLALVVAALALDLLASASQAAADTKPPPQSTKREQLTIAPESAMAPWTGDLDGMIERRMIRILAVYSKTFYFVDKGVQRGASYDIGRLFVDDLNRTLTKDSKAKTKHLKVQAVFIPVERGELMAALVAGKGDIVMSSFGVTEGRQQRVDFSKPLLANVSEVLVLGPDSPL